MNEKRINFLSTVSLIVITFTALFLLTSRILHLELPEIVVRVLGFAMLISIPVFVFTNVKKIQKI